MSDKIRITPKTRKRKPTDSPCIGTCSTVLGDEVCRGCGRTFEEVLNWHTFSDDEKKAINLRLKLEGKIKF
ncbi:DUF1289 domain-containing protein [Kangiella sp. TOML190]|uniref:DUF1289 domain-containing protein n=1 Tax=Kangiella sp. TOML190 TaxID=2931351 RepID=UPI00203E35B3|nr:DUF1289 domain-containing protein [Kangiella sp. TOML190]